MFVDGVPLNRANSRDQRWHRCPGKELREILDQTIPAGVEILSTVADERQHGPTHLCFRFALFLVTKNALVDASD